MILNTSSLALALALIASSVRVQAQVVDTTRTVRKPVVQTDTAKSVLVRPRSAVIAVPRKPPLTPKRAFVFSLLVPGLGQSRLDRGSAGAFFAAIELGSLAMVQKSSSDLREARRFSGDSLPGNYVLQTDGTILGSGSAAPKFPLELINSRRLHKEDWFAALAFNHLLSGADAFVAAQLWEVPASLSVLPSGDRVFVVATLHW